MRPQPPTNPAAEDLFRHQLSNLLDARHELVHLAELINWPRFDQAYGALYAECGWPGLPMRLMVGLHLLKHIKGLSDEQVCAQWLENPYFQAFCGDTLAHLIHRISRPQSRYVFATNMRTPRRRLASSCFRSHLQGAGG